MNISTQSQPDFQNYFQDWMTRLELYLNQLLHLLQSPDDQHDEHKHQQLIHLVMTHYHDYVIAKAQVISRKNVFIVLSAPWFNSYERTFQWLGGSKPGLSIYVVKSCGVELTSDQAERLERLSAETKGKEREITEKLARLEQYVVAPPMVALARLEQYVVPPMGTLAMVGRREVTDDVNVMVERLEEELEFLVEQADYLREKTVAEVVAILSTAQTVRFLAAAAQLQLRIRRRGQLNEMVDAN